jgi:glycosyltransferase involved in cell wall biosynthesis
MSDKPRILVSLSCYLPGYLAGGPIRSIANMVEMLGHEFDFWIVTSDRDRNMSVRYAGIQVRTWVEVGKARVIYLPPGIRGLWSLYCVLRDNRWDLLYLNSFFDRRSSMFLMFLYRLRLIAVKRILLAPRGEFSLGALSLKRLRKRLYLWMVKVAGCYENVVFHASTEYEAQDIRREFRRLTEPRDVLIARPVDQSRSFILTAPDPSGVLADRGSDEQCAKIAGMLRLVFVSRISRKKNLHFALELLKGIRGNVRFDIYGPSSDPSYVKACQATAAQLPANIQVSFHGPVVPDKVDAIFRGHDLFLLPTLGENFGHVIPESLMAGCPVLISDQTPWRGLEKARAGWDLPLAEVGQFQAVLQHCVNAGPEYNVLREGARLFGKACTDQNEIFDANMRMFVKVTQQFTAPVEVG